MIKILIAGYDDNLLKKLNSTQIVVTNVETNAKKIIESCKNNRPDIVILNFNNNYKLIYKKIVEKIYDIHFNKCISITATSERVYLCFDKIYLLFEILKYLEGPLIEKENTILDENISDMLWKLRFNLYSKGTMYLTKAIQLAYYDSSLLFDTNRLVSQISQIYSEDERNIRNNIDNALNIAFKDENLQYDIDFFNGYYDGRKISLKYFMVLAVHYMNLKMNSESDDISDLLLTI